MAIRRLFLPETAAVAESHGYVSRPWLSWCRDVMLQIGGEFLSPRFDAATFTATSGLWTLTDADVTSFANFRVGKLAFLTWDFTATTVSATPASVSVDLPNGWSAARAAFTLCSGTDNGTVATFVAQVASGGTALVFSRQDGANLSVAANATAIRGQMFFEVQ